MIRRYGFTVIAEGGTNPIADVVFIHGLQGHPKNTWTFDGLQHEGASPPAKRSIAGQILGGLKGKKNTEAATSSIENGTFWPKDLLAVTFKSCRVLTYGYDSVVSHFFAGPADKNTTADHGNNLLHSLEALRREQKARLRKIIFIVHSLGGLVIKDMLRRSRDASRGDEDLKDIYRSTYAIMFFGTPHRGSDYADIAILASNIALTMGFDANSSLLKDLKPNQEYPTLLRESFSKMLLEDVFYVDTFQESLGFKGIKGLKGKIVENDSSSLDYARERKQTIHANHRNICRFSGFNDEGWSKVEAALSRHLQGLEELVDLSQEKCLESLRIAEMSYRFNSIPDPSVTTQDWLYQRRNKNEISAGFIEWLQHGRGIFWIRGKPGSGKSTVMKNIYRNPNTQRYLPFLATYQPWMIISAFFHDRGLQVQKSLQGVLTTLLYQIVKSQPRLLSLIMPLGTPRWSKPSLTQTPEYVWTTEALQYALLELMTQTTYQLNVCMVVDALDEHEEDREDHNSMINFFVRLNKDHSTVNPPEVPRLKIIVSSRPERIFVNRLEGNKGFDIQHFTRIDIQKYVHNHLGNVMDDNFKDDEKESTKLDEFKKTLVEKAQGVFLWVALVVRNLLDLWERDVRDLWELEARLEQLPAGLEELYEYMLNRIEFEDREEAFYMLEMVLRARQPLSVIQLTLMIKFIMAKRSKRDYSEVLGWIVRNADKTFNRVESYGAMLRRIQSTCRGFLEIWQLNQEVMTTVDGPPTECALFVNFLHRTAKEYLVKPRSLALLFRDRDLPRPPGNGHVFALDFTTEWLSVPKEVRTILESKLLSHSHGAVWKAEAEVTYHAPLAEKTADEPCAELLNDLDGQMTAESPRKECWPADGDDRIRAKETNRSRLLAAHAAERFTFLAFAVTRNMSHYVKERLMQDSNLANRKVGKPLLHYAIYHSGFCGRLSMIRLLLDAGADIHKKYKDDLTHIYMPHTALQSMDFGKHYDETGEPVRTILKEMLSRGADPNSILVSNRQPLIFQVAEMEIPCRYKLELFKAFVAAGADLNREDRDGVCLLEIISENPSCGDFTFDAAEWLFDNGAKMTKRMHKRGHIHDYNNLFKPFTEAKYFHRSAVASTYASLIFPIFSSP